MGDYMLAYGEYYQGRLHPASLEILSPLREIANQLGKKLALLVLAPTYEEVQNNTELLKAICDEVLVVAHESLGEFKDDLYERVVVEVVKGLRPFGVFFPATLQGLALAPRVAGKLGVGLCAHVNALEIEDGKLYMLRPTYGENIMAKLYSTTLPVMATLALGAFSIKEGERAPIFKLWEMSSDFSWESKLKIRQFTPAKKEINRLSVAKVVLAGGLGLKKKENFEKLIRLAQLLEGEVGATRPLCHAGWVEEERMIGVSGISVRPKLYIGFGISGAIQHTVGMENSEFIIAVNTDKEAPLVKLAHLSLIADAEKVIDALLKKLETRP